MFALHIIFHPLTTPPKHLKHYIPKAGAVRIEAPPVLMTLMNCELRVLIPRGHVWLEGDNKAASHDSRHYGPVPVPWTDPQTQLIILVVY
jgi:hypothetical protein